MADATQKMYTIYYDLANDAPEGKQARFENGLDAVKSYDCDEFGIDWMQAMVVCNNYSKKEHIDTQFSFPLRYYVGMKQHFGARRNQKKARMVALKPPQAWNMSNSRARPDIDDINIG